MSMWTRVRNVFRGERLNGEIQEEMETHLAEAVAQGRDPVEARRAFGSTMRRGEESHSVRVVGWLDSLRADAVFGWRQLMKRKVTTGAAVLSLALGIGACTAAFRLVDALFLRPMPVSDPASLYAVSFSGFNLQTGEPEVFASNSYPFFLQIRDAVKGQADVVAASTPVDRTDITYGSVQEMEKAYRQEVSGELFSNFGLKPALGRLLTAEDDRAPGKSPNAVLSYDYWTQRFGQDRGVVGRTFHRGDTVYEIVGVAPKGFTGTEPGAMVDFFAPTMMNAGAIARDSDFWLRLFVRVKPGVDVKALQSKMNGIYLTEEKERVTRSQNFPKYLLDKYLSKTLTLKPAGMGSSSLQTNYGSALTALSVLVAMVLLIACANVANLMAVQAASRAREMALRVSIGAGRFRLVQMVMVESAMLGLMAAAVGLVFAWWAAPLVVSRINPPDNPAKLVLPADWVVVGFGLALAVGVTLLFGLIPALRASGVKPVSALKGGEEPHAKRRLMYALIAVQVAFCFVVLFVAGLFATTFAKLSKQPLGFSAERVLLLDTVAQHEQPAVKWDQMAATLRAVPGVQSAALEGWPLMSGTMHNDRISVNGSAPSEKLTFFLSVSPGWLNAMRIPLIGGRDFHDNDTKPGVAIVNEKFAKQYFNGANPVGSSFETRGPDGVNMHYEIVGLVHDVMYRDLREAILPQAYVPIHQTVAVAATSAATKIPSAGTDTLRPMSGATMVVRTSGDDPILLSETLRRAMAKADPELRVSGVTTQTGLVDAQTIRERLLATLALFFAGVALMLAAIGLYGVLSYSVLQRERELGTRIALGAQAGNIARLVTTRVFAMVLLGAVVGLGFGAASVRYVAALLYGVKASDASMLVVPTAVLLTAALLAALPAVMRAVRIDPVIMLRAE
jgi:putative ABC transport system permease protein